jgi:peptidyl-prolyl cis-trans isomerase SurA
MTSPMTSPMASPTKRTFANRFFATVILAALSALPAAAGVIEEIIAQVNDHAVVLSEYKRSLDSMRQELAQDSRGLDLEAKFNEKAKDALRDLIDQQLLVQQGSELGVSVDSEVVKRLDAIRLQMKLPSMEALEEAVAKQGMIYEDFKQNLKENLLTQQVINHEVGSRVQVTPQEISAYYEQHKQELQRPEGVHVQEILIATDEKKPEALAGQQKKAEDVAAQAKGGADFAELAKKNSDDTSAQNGGDAGFFERGNMAKEIETVAYALKKNQVSDPIHTKYGFVILKLLEHTQAGVPPLAEAETAIHEKIYYQKIQPSLREYLTKLRQESYIVIKPGYTDTGAPPAQQANAEKP